MAWTRSSRTAVLAAVFLTTGPAWGQAPGEVPGLAFGGPTTLTWSPVAGAAAYDVYRGSLAGLAAGVPARCHAYRTPGTSLETPAVPEPWETFLYLVTAESAIGEEGTAGAGTAGPRALLGRCAPVMRAHVLDRLGYGWNEWARDRVAALGSLQAYVDEQLSPGVIDESSNSDLNTRLAALEPPDNVVELVARQVVGAVYARRQLAEAVGSFWTNHFNTENRKVVTQFQRLFPPCQSPGQPPQCDAAYPQRANREATALQREEFDTFQALSFGGSFREILEASALSPAMMIFLDTVTSVAGAPNENYPRELLELYALGVGGGYTQTDVEELSRVFTGWAFCKKAPADVGNALAPCLVNYWDTATPGDWTANLQTARHDCGSKTLFAGTPQQVVLLSNCGNPSAQVLELESALDAIAAHPATPRFLSTKILERFVTDAPEQALVDRLVAEWNDPGNPAGVGDLAEVLRSALTSPEFLDPERVGSKVKTPLEHFASAFRAVRGRTNGQNQIFNYLTRAQMLPYLNPVPTGWPEHAADWIDTNNTLERQNFGIQLAAAGGTAFGSDPLGLLVANGISTAPGNTAAIVDFFAEALFGGALTPAELQKARDFLDTDDSGNPSPYTSARIRDLVGFLLGYPHFQEQ